MKTTSLLLLLTMSISTYAIEINLGPIIPGITCTGTFDFGTNCADFTAQISAELNKDLPDVDIQKYANGVANSMVIANSGKGTDYSQNFDLFTIKISGGLGLDASTNGIKEAFDDFSSADGVGVGGAFTGGINLDSLPIKKFSIIDFSKLDIFFNIFSLNIDKDLDSEKASGSFGGFGFMTRYQILEGQDLPSKYLFQWGGLHLHTGFQRSKMNLNYTLNFDDETVTYDSGGGISLNGTFSNSSGTLDIDSITNNIPIEVSTYARFLYILTLHGGVGMDITSGESNINFNGSGSVSGSASGGGGGSYTNSISANQKSSGSPEIVNLRGFMGLQINAPILSVSVNLNKNFSNDVFGLNVATNFSW